MKLLSTRWLAALAFAGTAGAHALGYALAAPDAHHRYQLMTETGHGDWTFVGGLALGAFVAACVALLRTGAGGRGWTIAVGARLVSFQLTGFVVLECLERISVGRSALALVGESVFWIGLLAQVVVAALLALALRGLLRVAELWHARRTDSIPSTGSIVPHGAWQTGPLRSKWTHCLSSPRAPPALA